MVAQFHAFGTNYDDMAFSPARLRAITARTLIVHGDPDPLFPVNIARKLNSGIAESSLWVIPGGDHIPIFGDLAPKFSSDALRFLRGTKPAC